MKKRYSEIDFFVIPKKYIKASDAKIARKLRKLPEPANEKKELVVQTKKGQIVF